MNERIGNWQLCRTRALRTQASPKFLRNWLDNLQSLPLIALQPNKLFDLPEEKLVGRSNYRLQFQERASLISGSATYETNCD